MKTSIELPQWLDNLIFEQLGAKYCRCNSDMTVIDWDKNDVLNYLGTYFPRSYAESYCIFEKYFKYDMDGFCDKTELSILDFGCGTGGEIIGLITVLFKYFKNLKKVRIVAIDGNLYALQLYEKVLNEFMKRIDFEIESHSAHICIDDFYDLSILNNVIKRKFDIIISFKAICEFVTKQQFEKENAYKHITGILLPKLTDWGLMLLVDVTTYNNTSQEWLPKMLDRGLAATGCYVTDKNEGYNQTYIISHSRTTCDASRVAWRMITKKK